MEIPEGGLLKKHSDEEPSGSEVCDFPAGQPGQSHSPYKLRYDKIQLENAKSLWLAGGREKGY